MNITRIRLLIRCLEAQNKLKTRFCYFLDEYTENKNEIIYVANYGK